MRRTITTTPAAECDECGDATHPGKPCRTAAEILAECAPPADYAARFRAERAASIARADANRPAAEQLDIFGTATPVATPATPTTPTAADDVQLSLFRPDFRAVRAPKPRKAAAPVTLDPALHTDALI